MDRDCFEIHLGIIKDAGKRYSQKYQLEFDPSHLEWNYYEELRQDYKEKLFYNETELIDIVTIVAIYTLAYINKPLFKPNPIGHSFEGIELTPEEIKEYQEDSNIEMLTFASVKILQTEVIEEFAKTLPDNKKANIYNFDYKPQYLGNVKYYLKSLEKPVATLYSRSKKPELVFPLSQIYKNYYLYMQLSFLKKVCKIKNNPA